MNLFALLHALTGVDTDEIALCARRLREATPTLFVKETRGEASARATPRQVSHLLIMLLSEAPAIRAGKTIERADQLEFESDDMEKFRDWEEAPPHLYFFRKPHSFLDAVEHLLKCAIEKPHEFRGDYHHHFGHSSIVFNRSAFTATIHLYWEPAYEYFGRIDSEATRTGGVPRRAEWKLDYSAHDIRVSPPTPRHMFRSTEMPFSLFHELGEAIARAGAA